MVQKTEFDSNLTNLKIELKSNELKQDSNTSNINNLNNFKIESNLNNLKIEEKIHHFLNGINLKELKLQRIQLYSFNHFTNNCEISDEFYDFLQDSFNSIFSREINKKLFSFDYRKLIEIINFFNTNLIFPDNFQELSDLFFKWCFARIWGNSNINLTKSMLELIKKVVLSLNNKNNPQVMLTQEIDYFLAIFKELINNFGELHFFQSFYFNLFKEMKEINKDLKKISNFLYNEFNQCENLKIKEWLKNIICCFYINNLPQELIILFQKTSDKNTEQSKRNSLISDNKDNNILIESADKTNVFKLIGMFNEGNFSEKLEILVLVQDLLTNNEKIILNNGKEAVKLLFSKLENFFLERIEKNEKEPFINYFLNSLSKMFSSKTLISQIDEEFFYQIMNFILKYLIIEDESKNEKGLETIKSLNGLAMTILENGPSSLIYSTLFNLLIYYRRKESYNKMIGLIIKCILKLAKVIEYHINYVKIEELLILFQKYTGEFINDENSNDVGLKVIRTIIGELYKLEGNNIYTYYCSALNNKNEIIIKR